MSLHNGPRFNNIGVRQYTQFSLSRNHSLFFPFSIFFLAFHPVVRMLINRKTKQRSENEAEKGKIEGTAEHRNSKIRDYLTCLWTLSKTLWNQAKIGIYLGIHDNLKRVQVQFPNIPRKLSVYLQCKSVHGGMNAVPYGELQLYWDGLWGMVSLSSAAL